LSIVPIQTGIGGNDGSKNIQTIKSSIGGNDGSKNIQTRNVLENSYYSIIKIKINDMVPNLNSFISHSTDTNFMNGKDVSDLNDFIFNKPFIMAMNNSPDTLFSDSFDLISSFQVPNLYFYNIPFKINGSSKITLNDQPIIYILPISSQQYFIKGPTESEDPNVPSDPYYVVDLNSQDNEHALRVVLDNEVVQSRFNPSFDEFNLSNLFLNKNYYGDIWIDTMTDKIRSVLDTNPDYQIVTDLMDSSNNIYTNIFTDLLLSPSYPFILYGVSTFSMIQTTIPSINKLDNVFNDKTFVYDLLKFANEDFLKYSHSALRLSSSADLAKIKLSDTENSLNLLSPIYLNYNSSSKISTNLQEYLLNVRNFFKSHIDYVNNNIDYLNLSDPNNYKEQFLSFSEIQQDKYNKYYNYDDINISPNTLTLLHPIIDNNIYKIQVSDTNGITTLTNFNAPIDKSIITSKDYTNGIIKNNYHDSELKIDSVKSVNKFNYLGILSIDHTNSVIFQDKYIETYFTEETSLTYKYFKLDNNKIFQSKLNQTNRYEFNSTDMCDNMVINPTELKFGDVHISDSTMQLDTLPMKFVLYKLNIEWDTDAGAFENQISVAYFLFGEMTCVGYYFAVTENSGELYLLIELTDNINIKLNLTNDYLFYNLNDLNDYSFSTKFTNSATWQVSNKMKNIHIENFIEPTFTCELDLNIMDCDIFRFGNRYYDVSDIFYIRFGSVAYLHFSQTDLDQFIPIIATSGDHNVQPTDGQINKYIIDNDYLYKAILVSVGAINTNEWEKILSGTYFVTSLIVDEPVIPEFANQFCSVINGIVTVDEVPGPNIDYIVITVGLGDHSQAANNDQIGTYIYDNNLLYKGEINENTTQTFNIVVSGTFRIISTTTPITKLPDYDKKYIYIESAFDGEIYKNTIFLYGKKEFEKIQIDNNEYKIIDNNLYHNNTLVRYGYFFIKADDQHFNNQYVQINTTLDEPYSSLTIYDPSFNKVNFISIIANKGDINNLPNSDYIIDHDKLYLNNNGIWKLLTFGYYKITSDDLVYTNKYAKINLEGDIIIVSYFNSIVANDPGLSSDNYVINDNKLYKNTNNIPTQIISGFYLINSDNANYSNKYVKAHTDGMVIVSNEINKPENNMVVYFDNPTMVVKNNVIYPYYIDYELTKKIQETSINNYLLLVDQTTIIPRHWMFRLRDINKIPKGNYNCWLLEKNMLDLVEYDVSYIVDINGSISELTYDSPIPIHSYYMVINEDNSCIYYYDGVDMLWINDVYPIEYYNINLNSPTTMNKIYLVCNDLLNVQMKQLVKIFYNKESTENFISKEITMEQDLPPLNFDSINDLAYKSEYTNNVYVVKCYNDKTIGLIGENEIICNMILRQKVAYNEEPLHAIYYPIVIKKFEKFVIPNITFKISNTTFEIVNVTFSGEDINVYNNSYIPIKIDARFNDNNDGTWNLNEDLVIGKINTSLFNANNSFTSLMASIDIDFVDTAYIITIASDRFTRIFNGFLMKCSIQGTTVDGHNYLMYFWIIFTTSDLVVQDYLTLYSEISGSQEKNGISQPFYLSENIIPNYGAKYEIIGCNPNIIIANDDNWILNTNVANRDICYRYWTDTRHENVTDTRHMVRDLDFNAVFNVKPNIEFWQGATNDLQKITNPSLRQLNNTEIVPVLNSTVNIYENSTIFILTYVSKSSGVQMYNAFLKSEFDKFMNFDLNPDVTQLYVYYSVSYPQFVYNPFFIIAKENNIYEISKYLKLYLEAGEIIIIDGNYFYVNGLNVFNDYYELIKIRGTTYIRSTQNGYYTIGNFKRKNIVKFPSIDYQTTLQYHKSININLGDMYYNYLDGKLHINKLTGQKVDNVGLFDDSSLHVKLFHTNQTLYLLDNFVKFKIGDKLIDINIYEDSQVRQIYTIVDMRDGLIYFDRMYTWSNNVFVDFILPYQPWESKYVEFDSDGSILSTEIADRETVVIDYKIVTFANIEDLSSIQPGIYKVDTNYYIKTDSGGLYQFTVYTELVVIYASYNAARDYLDTIDHNDCVVIIDDTLYQWTKLSKLLIVILNLTYVYITNSNIDTYCGEFYRVDDNKLIACGPKNVYQVFNNKIDVDLMFVPGYKWINIMNTRYISHFENVMRIPQTSANLTLEHTLFNNDYPIEIMTEYNNSTKLFSVQSDFNIIDNYQFYYLQPVKIGGTYNYIKSINTTESSILIKLLNPIDTELVDIKLIISPKFSNTFDYFSQISIRHNGGIQLQNYNKLTKIQVVRYVLDQDRLIFIQKKNNSQDILFEYGKSIIDNEKDNGISDSYSSVYFYNYKALNADGTISNFDTLVGSWHLLLVQYIDFQLAVLCKIIYPNRIKTYTELIQNYDYNYSLDRIFTVKINSSGDFTYNPLIITQSKNLIEINNNNVNIIKKYDIRLLNVPVIDGEYYKQEIEFIGYDSTNIPYIPNDYTVDVSIYSFVYLDSLLQTSCEIIYDDKFILKSQTYLSNNIKNIYTSNLNYLVSAERPKTKKTDKKMNDSSIEYFIDKRILDYEYLTCNVYVGKISPENSIYYYKLIDLTHTFSFPSSDEYKINQTYLGVKSINNVNKTMIVNDLIDNDLLEISDDFVKVQIYIKNSISVDTVMDPVRLFNDVKQLRTKLISNSIVNNEFIYNFLKPWQSWSILSSINKVNSLETLVDKCYLQWNNDTHEIDIKRDTIISDYSYITNDEKIALSKFLKSMNTTDNSHFEAILNIESAIFDNLANWLSNPSFFLNVQSNINEYLMFLNYDVIFDGNNFVFNNQPVEEYNYITYDFVYDTELNVVYRSINSFNQIHDQISAWINKQQNSIDKAFGVSIYKLCRYLVKLGDEFKLLIDEFVKPFSDSPQYVYNNPIKFIINKLWEKNQSTGNLNKLYKQFTDQLILVYSIDDINKILSSLNFYGDLTINQTGVNSLNFYNGFNYINDIRSSHFTELNINRLEKSTPVLPESVNTNLKLITKPLYPYLINFNKNQIRSNVVYSLNFLNGDKITSDIVLKNPILTPSQLNFYSEYDIKPDDFVVVIQHNEYVINSSELLGHLYRIQFSGLDNLNFIDEIYYRDYNLPIVQIIENNIDVLIPYTVIETSNLGDLRSEDLFELRNTVGIKSINSVVVDNKTRQYLTFYSLKFNFIPGKTLLKIQNIIYQMFVNSNNMYYVIGQSIPIMTGQIILMVHLNMSTNLNEVLYQYMLNSLVDNAGWNFNNNIIIPQEFKLVDTQTNTQIVPIKIHCLGDDKLILHFTTYDYNTIKNIYDSNINGFDKITQSKKLDHNISNKIEDIELINEFVYTFNFVLPRTSDTVIYLYEPNDIDIDIGIYEPEDINKASIYINQSTSQTLFTLSEYFTLDNFKIIQKNQWTIEDYSIINKTLQFKIPSDFILDLTDQYYYKFGGNPIDSSTFVFSSGTLKIDWPFDETVNTLFQQYYIESASGVIISPELNRVVKIQSNYAHQYNTSEQFYIVPYAADSSEFDQYLYLISTSEPGLTIGFEGGVQNENLYLYSNGVKYKCKIFDRYYNGYLNYLVSFGEQLDLLSGHQYTYSLEDQIVKNVNAVYYYQNSLQHAQYYKQESLDYVYLFVNNNIHEYKYQIDLIKKPNKFYLVSYFKYVVKNQFNEIKFIQTNAMKKNIIYQNNETVTTAITPTWSNYSKLFEYISFYFNDQLIEKLDEDIYQIDYYLYSTEEKRRQIDQMTKIKLVTNSSGVKLKWELYLPLIFWFAGKSGLSIPVVALPYTQLRLVYKLNDIKHALTNNLANMNYSFSSTPEVKVNLMTDFILLDTFERNLFGSYSHEYIINKYIKYSHNFVNVENINLSKQFNGLINSIHLITKPMKHPNLTYYPNIITNYDARYATYIIALDYYNAFIIDNIYTSDEQRDYSINISTILAVNIELKKYLSAPDKTIPEFDRINRLIDNFNQWKYWDENYEFLKYLMYWDIFYLSSDSLSNSRKTYILTIYIKYHFKNEIIIDPISPIETLCIKANGSDLFSARDWTYFTNVIPVQKYKNSLPTGYYTYSFSLYPTDDQYSGHLNFSHFDDITFQIQSNELVNTSPYKLVTIAKEYNILRLMSGIGSLAWIN
jgi:hypothetical protein